VKLAAFVSGSDARCQEWSANVTLKKFHQFEFDIVLTTDFSCLLAIQTPRNVRELKKSTALLEMEILKIRVVLSTHWVVLFA
jgi:hypothetical protein